MTCSPEGCALKSQQPWWELHPLVYSSSCTFTLFNISSVYEAYRVSRLWFGFFFFDEYTFLHISLCISEILCIHNCIVLCIFFFYSHALLLCFHQRSLGSALMSAGARLTELDLSDNAFGPDGVKGIEQLLKSPSCYTLKELKLNNCGMGVGGGKVSWRRAMLNAVMCFQPVVTLLCRFKL